MLENFVCPDKEVVLVEDCLKKCRMGERCLTLPTLKLISNEREWNGTASTTQLLNGTMLEYLKITQPYDVVPEERAFMLAGTLHHKALEEVAKELGLAAEIPLSVDRDIFDLIEVEEEGLVLTDYKLWGSYKVAKALGIVEVGKQPDPTGAVYKSTGKWGKKGDPKMIPIFDEIPELASNWEAEYQLNRYRVMLEDLGIKINRMQLQVTVRDGGLALAHQRGVFNKMRRIPVEFIDSHEVKDYFEYKAGCLNEALAEGWDTPCNNAECWDDVRCRSYCDVAQYCPKGQIVKSIEGGE